MKDKDLRALVLGSGGREHAIALSLARSSRVSRVLVSPGNGGSFVQQEGIAPIENVPGVTGEKAAVFCQENKIDFVFVGPEQPLVDGIQAHLAKANIPCFGPSAKAALLEGSKKEAKLFMAKHKIPTARFGIFTDSYSACEFVASVPYDVVVKASGLAAGKGVIVPKTKQEAKDACVEMLDNKSFSGAGETIVVEERINGSEMSVLIFCDGENYVVMPPTEDFKRAKEGDEGLNTGGMGAVAPARLLLSHPSLLSTVEEKIVGPTVKGLNQEGRGFVGVLYVGVMVTEAGDPYVLEYNCRFGDPETQVILPLLKTDLVDIVEGCVEGSLPSVKVEWNEKDSCVCVVAVSGGYPGSYEKQKVIHGLREAAAIPNTTIYHAGTAYDQASQSFKTSGGRVLACSSLSSTPSGAASLAYSSMMNICFDKINYRRDIGRHPPTLPKCNQEVLKVGVLGSTRGTDLQAIIDAIENKRLLGVKIVAVGSNISSSGILARAQQHKLPTFHVKYEKPQTKENEERERLRKEGDEKVKNELIKADCDIVLLIGWMRVLSDEFVDSFRGRLLNVHPSLLPKFGNTMDQDTHTLVLSSDESETGCTIHQVTEEVDKGEVLSQKKCDVVRMGDFPDDVDSLKKKVQALEGSAFVEILESLRDQKKINLKRKRDEKEEKENGGLTYKDAGVDVTKGNTFVDIIKPYAKATSRIGSDASLGGFGAMFDLKKLNYKDPIICSTTDGVGTKLLLAQKTGIHGGVGVDLVAMCVNDLIVQGAEPVFFLDYYATGKLDLETAPSVVKGVADGCLQSNCALSGGETAEMPGLYATEEYDMAGFAVGIVEREKVLPKMEKMSSGNILVALSSVGVHSNGFSLVRRVVDVSGASLQGPVPYASSQPSLAHDLLTPTRIYTKTLLPLYEKFSIFGAAHITGGGLTENLPRALPSHLDAVVDCHTWKVPPVFGWLREQGKVERKEMLRTFNCGVGMVLIMKKEDHPALLEFLSSLPTSLPGDGVVIGELVDAKKEEERVHYTNLDQIF